MHDLKRNSHTISAPMPMDAAPTLEGEWYVDGQFTASPALPTSSERYVSHFATCPNAAQHRKPKAHSKLIGRCLSCGDTFPLRDGGKHQCAKPRADVWECPDCGRPCDHCAETNERELLRERSNVAEGEAGAWAVIFVLVLRHC